MTQTRITQFFGLPENANRPERFLFGVGMNELDVSLENRNDLGTQLGIIDEGEQLNREVIENWFADNLEHPQRFIFGCDVEETEYMRMIGTALGFIEEGQQYDRELATEFFEQHPDHQDRYIFNM